jgi:hypothetical protein
LSECCELTKIVILVKHILNYAAFKDLSEKVLKSKKSYGMPPTGVSKQGKICGFLENSRFGSRFSMTEFVVITLDISVNLPSNSLPEYIKFMKIG